MPAEDEVLRILQKWEQEYLQPAYNVLPVLTKLAEILEQEEEQYLKKEPDPFDERHPSKIVSSGSYGATLKVLFRKDLFISKLLSDYLRENYWTRITRQTAPEAINPIITAALRLMIDILPGLDAALAFESPTDELLTRLYNWVDNSVNTDIQTYATGIIAAALEQQEVANLMREENCRLVPLMLTRLQSLFSKFKREQENEKKKESATVSSSKNYVRPFAKFSSEGIHRNFVADVPQFKKERNLPQSEAAMSCHGGTNSMGEEVDCDADEEEDVNDFSNSSWAETEKYALRTSHIYPVTLKTEQIFILKYLAMMGVYQEFIPHAVEKNAMKLILEIIDKKNWQSAFITFEALRYLASLLCHKKLAIEFVNMKGVEKLIQVPKIGIAATGVSVCLFYLAHCEDAIERICQLPTRTVSKLVQYALWLMELGRHDSGRCHATIFFGLCFQFRLILKEFDDNNGIAKLFNFFGLLNSNITERNGEIDEDSAMKQICRHMCTTLKRYMEAHLFSKSESVRRACIRDGILNDDGELRSVQREKWPISKISKLTPELVRQEINFLLTYMNYKAHWTPVDDLMVPNRFDLLLKVIYFTYEWNYSGRAETVRSTLDVINICCVLPSTLIALCTNRIVISNTTNGDSSTNNIVGISIILSAAEGEIVKDAEVQKAALNVLITCACAPIDRDISSLSVYSSGGGRKKWCRMINSSDELIQKVWESIRKNNGIMILTTLLNTKMPITDADEIRALACEVLVGLARRENVRQIISKLPLIVSGQLQCLMRDPILQNKRQEHVRFNKWAKELLEKVFGKNRMTMPAVEDSIYKANVVAQTNIKYNNQQLNEIIRQHLLSQGLKESAEMLAKEANLAPTDAPIPVKTPLAAARSHPLGTKRIGVEENWLSDVSMCTDGQKKMKIGNGVGDAVQSCSSSNFHRTLSLPGTPIAVKRCVDFKTPPPCSANGNPMQMERSFQKQQFMRELVREQKAAPIQEITLDCIVKEYLARQHSLCRNPITTCPEFDLFTPHKCPDPKPKNVLYGNFALRYSKGVRMRRQDYRLIHSKFCAVKTFKPEDMDGDVDHFTHCEFMDEKTILAGTNSGRLRFLSIYSTVNMDESIEGHTSYISNIALDRECKFATTSSIWTPPKSTLWRIHREGVLGLTSICKFDEEEVLEFSHLKQDRLIGTTRDVATIYDIATGVKVLTLKPSHSNQYVKNRAIFDPTDSLVLSDGVLWDVKSGKEIHKFDKLNQMLSGVFHPNGLEIISNTEIWDVRTFHLMKTVSSLDHCFVRFPQNYDTFYAIRIDREDDEGTDYDTSFKTFDAFDYSDITTVEVKKSVCHLTCNKYDTQLALLEIVGSYGVAEESAVRVYDVGRQKDDDDEDDEEEEDQEDEIYDVEDDDDDEDDDYHSPVDDASSVSSSDSDI